MPESSSFLTTNSISTNNNKMINNNNNNSNTNGNTSDSSSTSSTSSSSSSLITINGNNINNNNSNSTNTHTTSPNTNGLSPQPTLSSTSTPSQANQPQVAPTEKPAHYTYLKGFRVEQCSLFLQHKCTQHRPYTCFYWHFKNQRRRRPLRKRDGTFNYNPDTYCDKYDEQTGICPNSDECPYVHRNAGDTEKRYHLRYYKTATCIHETDSKGNCAKNGVHCAFAHGAADMRPPVYDIRELQLQQQQQLTSNTSSNSNTNNNSTNNTSSSSSSSSTTSSSSSSTTSSSDANQITPSTNDLINEKTLNLSTSLEKERLLNEDPKWNDTQYVLLYYKTEQCRRPPRLCRQGFACPQYHNARDKRRNPSVFKYRSTPCPNVKQGDDWLEPTVCENGDHCKYCHSRTEQQFHPEIYKSSKCNDMITTGYCPRGPFCAFAHIEQELKNQRAHSTSESSSSDYTLENFISNVLPNNTNISNTNTSNNKENEHDIQNGSDLIAPSNVFSSNNNNNSNSSNSNNDLNESFQQLNLQLQQRQANFSSALNFGMITNPSSSTSTNSTEDYLVDSSANSHLSTNTNQIGDSSSSTSNLINSTTSSNLILSGLANNHVLAQTNSPSNLVQQQQQQQMFLYNKPIGSEREKPKLQQQISQQLVLNSTNTNKPVGIISPESDNSINLNGNQLILNELDVEKLRHDLIRQAEMSSKLETLCLQYRQWVEKLTNDVNDWKNKYIRCETEKKLLETQLLNKLSLEQNIFDYSNTSNTNLINNNLNNNISNKK